MIAFFDEMTKHQLRGGEIGDGTSLQWSDGADSFGCTTQHLLRLLSNCEHFWWSAAIFANGNNRRFVANDAYSPDVNNRVRRPEIDSEIVSSKGKSTQRLPARRIHHQSPAQQIGLLSYFLYHVGLALRRGKPCLRPTQSTQD
jgi:hypothetical protein